MAKKIKNAVKKQRTFYTRNLKDQLTKEQLEIIKKALEECNSPLTLDDMIAKYRNMYYRCYSENNHESHPYNKENTICDEWLDEEEGLFNFCIWCIRNYYEIDGEGTLQLDKDILVRGNTVYSPETCCFVPKRINAMFGGSAKKNNNGLPTGVIYSKKTGKYKPQVRGFDGKVIKNIGWYDTVEEAWNVYALHKKAWILVVADMYKNYIPAKLYNTMINWELKITD